MKIILVPIFISMMAFFYTLCTVIGYIFALLLVLIWSFRLMSYSELSNNERSFSVVCGLVEPYYDKNPLETFLRIYNITD